MKREHNFVQHQLSDGFVMSSFPLPFRRSTNYSKFEEKVKITADLGFVS